MEKLKNLGTTIMEKINVITERAKTDKKFCAALIGGAAVVVALIIALVVALGGGGAQGTVDGTEGGSPSVGGQAGTYTVFVKTQGGMALSEIDVAVYSDDAHTNLLDYKTTDAEGKATLSLDAADSYYIVLSGAPKGYVVKDNYSFEGTTANIVLESALITGEDISTAQLKLGDVMYDFTVTTPDGTKVTLSEVLKEKKLVVLNFWYTTCSWCVTEFPIMAEAYEKHKDNVEVIALNPMGEGSAAVQSFKEQYKLPFPTAECPTSWSNVFSIQGYPTTIMIDQYGVICVVESGAVTSLRPWISAFEHFTADNYEQKLCANGVSDLVTQIKPTYEMPKVEDIAATINKGDIKVNYRAEEGDAAEYTWPFVIGEKNGEKCIYASNKGIEDSYAILYADVELKKGQAVGFDYLSSCEYSNDALVVIVNDKESNQITGWSEKETWQSCYPVVADEDGTYEVAFCFLKDESTNEGDDTVYIRNLRVVDEEDIDTATYLPREAAVTKDDGATYKYVDIEYNSKDGYYHVGSKNGPLLLAGLTSYTQFNEEQTVYEMIYADGTFMVGDKDRFEDLEQYANYASNARPIGLCPVTKDLKGLLEEFAKQYGFEDSDKEWMKICKYYAAYGTDEQLEDPIKGLASFSAYEAKLGKNVSTNKFIYDRAIIPRGMFAEFKPSKSGVYRITSHNESEHGVDAWIFNENRQELLVYEPDERMFQEEGEVSMVFYMEAGKPYYINIAFWDVYEVGTITYDIEYVASSYELFRLASPGYFTYDTNATGDAMYYTIAGGIDVVLGDDGIYYEDLGNGKKGSKLYADFTGITGIFSNPIMTNQGVKGMIDMGGFDFSKTENDNYVLSIIESQGSVEKADEYLKELWGEDYDGYAAEYQLEDVYAGRYHGEGKDYTDAIKKYVDKIDKSGNEERNGCVVVTEELAEILQMLMDKYTFENVDHSWTKLCYYYDYLGPEK